MGLLVARRGRWTGALDRLHAGLLQLDAEAALVVFRHRGALNLVAFVEEGKAEVEGDIREDDGVLGPGIYIARRYHCCYVTVSEPGAVALDEGHPHRCSLI